MTCLYDISWVGGQSRKTTKAARAMWYGNTSTRIPGSQRSKRGSPDLKSSAIVLSSMTKEKNQGRRWIHCGQEHREEVKMKGSSDHV